MKKKLRKFAEGGFQTKMGRNEGASIDEDVRSKAMKYVEGLDGIKGSDIADEAGTVKGSIKRNEYGDLYDSAMKATPKVTPKATSKAAPAVAPAMPAEEKERIANIGKKQKLEGVYPEEMIGGGGVKLLQVAGSKLAGKIATDRAARQAAEAAVKKQTRRSEEGFDPADALAAREKVKTDELIKKAQRQTRVPKNISKAEQEARRERYLSTGPMEDAFGTGSQFKRGFKAGGKVSKADMKKAGFYDKDKTKSERQNIVKKVTTKPQRIAIVEKAFSSKNMKSGGMASRRADGCAIRGKTRA